MYMIKKLLGRTKLRNRPTALKTKMKMRVQDTRPVSQAHLDLSTAEIPKKMKMMVSAMLARVFIVYFTVVRDFWEMLASTYLLAPIPQKVILRRERQKEKETVVVGFFLCFLSNIQN